MLIDYKPPIGKGLVNWHAYYLFCSEEWRSVNCQANFWDDKNPWWSEISCNTTTSKAFSVGLTQSTRFLQVDIHKQLTKSFPYNLQSISHNNISAILRKVVWFMRLTRILNKILSIYYESKMWAYLGLHPFDNTSLLQPDPQGHLGQSDEGRLTTCTPVEPCSVHWPVDKQYPTYLSP